MDVFTPIPISSTGDEFVPIHVPKSWQEFPGGMASVMDLPVTYVKWIIDLAKTLGYLDSAYLNDAEIPDKEGNNYELLTTIDNELLWKKISEFPNNTALSLTDKLLIQQLGGTKNVSIGDLLALIPPSTIVSDLESLSDVQGTTLAPNGKILKKIGGIWQPADEATGGGGGLSYTIRENESPTGVQDVTNVEFITDFDFIPLSIKVYLNGQRLSITNDYTEIAPNKISFVLPPYPNDKILVDYRIGTDASGSIKENEVPSGIKDGVNLIFNTTLNYTSGSTKLYLNGQRLFEGDDYTEISTNIIHFIEPLQTTDKLIIDYKY